MFYSNQPEEQKEQYKEMLKVMGSLTQLFSENESPYLAYRAHENIFCKFFEAENLARYDSSADAKKGTIGIGLKTWVGNGDQKVAEFGRLREQYEKLTGIELVKTIAGYRNERLRITKNSNGISELIYHVVKRIPKAMQVFEYAFEEIDIENISLIADRGNANNTYFTDKKHTYHFSISKNTLYMLFDEGELLEEFPVEILQDPYSYLLNLTATTSPEEEVTLAEVLPTVKSVSDRKNKLCLRLYSVAKDVPFVAEKSGLNQWNAGGRKRHADELYIPYPVEDRKRKEGFFPARDTDFKLTLPDGNVISAKVCQDGGKAIMSNPNKVLGEWLLRKVFELPEKTLVTYEMLEKFGIDSVVFTKVADLEYTINFATVGTYEKFYSEDGSNPESED